MSDTHDQHITDLEKQVTGLRVRLNLLEEIIKSNGFNDDSIPDEEDDVGD